jgi:hypothetical protein
MFEATDTRHAPWRLIRSDDKRRARLNVISHILEMIPYKKIAREKGQAAEAIRQRPLQRSGQPAPDEVRRRTVLKQTGPRNSAAPPPPACFNPSTVS